MSNTIYQKLLELQKNVGAIAKDSTNPFFKSKYFDINGLLEVVKPELNKQKLIIMQPLDGDKLKTLLIDAETGEKIESTVNLPSNPDPQKMGSIITYFRRYSLTSLLALQAEDDDANMGANINNGHTITPPQKPSPSAPQPKPANLSGLDKMIEEQETRVGISVFTDTLALHKFLNFGELINTGNVAQKNAVLKALKGKK